MRRIDEYQHLPMSRHRHGKYEPPEVPMSLKEAQQLLRELVSEWLEAQAPRR